MSEEVVKGLKFAQILVVDDDESTAVFLAGLLKKQGYDVCVAGSVKQATAFLQSPKRDIAVVVSDLRLSSNEEGTELIPLIKAQAIPPSIIFITGFGSIDSAVVALHEGAFAYISKPDNLKDIESELIGLVGRAVKQREMLQVGRRLTPVPSNGTASMVGSSPAMVKLYRAVAKASLTRDNVLILGESGTGKELVARAIHEKSSWADKPFVTVNCCALTETLLDSELFGHLRGAFTGATQNKKGLFEEATGGTLFLDEIGDIPPFLQVKLLRAIQEGEIKPVGSSEVRKVDVRLVAATHRDLFKLVQAGSFREDLYYRLKVFIIETPPLRARLLDLPDLVNHFVGRYRERSGKMLSAVSDDAMKLLSGYSWPGNIRELENAISQAAAMSNTHVLFPEDFPPEIGGGERLALADADAPQALPSISTADLDAGPGESLEDIERRHIERVLKNVNFNKSKAAEVLGIDRVTLYRKAVKYGILSKSASSYATVTQPSEDPVDEPSPELGISPTTTL